jgi:hypothetical protein
VELFITYLRGNLMMTNIDQIENTINETCDLLDNVTSEVEKKLLEAKLFELVEQLNGNTIYLTVQ